MIDLRGPEEINDWTPYLEETQKRQPFTCALWICPARHWSQKQKELIAVIQTVRKIAGPGGNTGPTALIAPDFMPLDWVGPVRSLAIPIYGTTAEIEWQDGDGHTHRTSPLEPPPKVSGRSEFVALHGRRPKADLL